jgi:chromosome segregation protein
MKFDRLRLAGFKSFCDPTEFKIEPGLTGVVGPNGCGKSNLVEALRWVMGESSYKNMRASGMDEVIFSGAGARPSRNLAEVGLTLDNSERRAPAAFSRARPIASTAAKCARATCSCCSPTPRPARARRLWCARARSARSSPPSRRRGG